jgi:hypothetical protein
MSTFILGASAAIVVAVLGWLVVNVFGALLRVKSLETQTSQLWLEIQGRCDSIERNLNDIEQTLNRRIDDNFSYTDSRFDKFANTIERNYVSKVDKASNTISYNG